MIGKSTHPTSAHNNHHGRNAWAIQPICVVCVSDCDAKGLFTSCHHFLCARCRANMSTQTCPRCRKPCKAVIIGQSTSLQSLLRHPTTPMGGTTAKGGPGLSRVYAGLRVAEFERNQFRTSISRLRELVSLFNGQHRKAVIRIRDLERQLSTQTELIQHMKQQQSWNDLMSTPNRRVTPSLDPFTSGHVSHQQLSPPPTNPHHRVNKSIHSVSSVPFRLDTPAIALEPITSGYQQTTTTAAPYPMDSPSLQQTRRLPVLRSLVASSPSLTIPKQD